MGQEKKDGWYGFRYGQRHLDIGYFMVFRVVKTGIGQSGKVIEILKTCRLAISQSASCEMSFCRL